MDGSDERNGKRRDGIWKGRRDARTGADNRENKWTEIGRERERTGENRERFRPINANYLTFRWGIGERGLRLTFLFSDLHVTNCRFLFGDSNIFGFRAGGVARCK